MGNSGRIPGEAVCENDKSGGRARQGMRVARCRQGIVTVAGHHDPAVLCRRSEVHRIILGKDRLRIARRHDVESERFPDPGRGVGEVLVDVEPGFATASLQGPIFAYPRR